jgi:hypothetical protein
MMCVELSAVYPLVDRTGRLNFSLCFLKKFYLKKTKIIKQTAFCGKSDNDYAACFKNAVNFLFA